MYSLQNVSIKRYFTYTLQGCTHILRTWSAFGQPKYNLYIWASFKMGSSPYGGY